MGGAYANVTGTSIRLARGATSFPLVIFYGAGIKPVTFNALLNGDNISGRFTRGRSISDTHRLVFEVE